MAKITYTDKTNPVAVTNRVQQSTAEDFNEIKSVVNENADKLGNVIPFDLYADLPATGVAGLRYKVENDPDTVLVNPPESNNGYYHWNGSAYVKDFGLAIGIVESGNSDAVSGGTIYDYLVAKDRTATKSFFVMYDSSLKWIDFASSLSMPDPSLNENEILSPTVSGTFTNLLDSGAASIVVPSEYWKYYIKKNSDGYSVENINSFKFLNSKELGTELNLKKTGESSITFGQRINVSGEIMTDSLYFMLNYFLISEGERISSVSSDIGLIPTYSFYNSTSIGSGSFISQSSARSATAPAGTVAVVINAHASLYDSYIFMKLPTGYPILGQITYDLSDIYRKNEIDEKIDVKIDYSKILTEHNIVKTATLVDGQRAYTSGLIAADSNYFRTEIIPVSEGIRYAAVGGSPIWSFYNNSTPEIASFVSQVPANTEVTVPAEATHMLFHDLNTVRDTLIVEQLDSGFPILGERTELFNELYLKTEIDEKVDAKIDNTELFVELDELKKNTIVIGQRAYTSGLLAADGSYFRTEPFAVTEGDRYAAVSSNYNDRPYFTFYNSVNAEPGTFISQTVGLEIIIPTGATYMVIHAKVASRDVVKVRQMDQYFPLQDENTYILKEIYTKTEIDSKLSEWIPDVWELDLIWTESSAKVLLVDNNDIKYGTNGFRDIFKATKDDLTDSVVVCTLNSMSSLKKILFVSSTKAVGYVQSSIEADEGFYCFDNADTNAWTARRISKMIAGAPPFEFQGMCRAETNGYLFACSYGTKDTDPAPVNVYRSIDDGETWSIVYTHFNTANQHIHSVEFDHFRNRVWATIGDLGGGGRPGWIWSDDYGDTWSFIEHDGTKGFGLMDTAILPTRKYVLFGTDTYPAGIRRWQPLIDTKNANVVFRDVENHWLVPVDISPNFGFARRPVVDTSVYPYRIAMSMSHTESYSNGSILISPDYRNWFFMNHVTNPSVNGFYSSFGGITSEGVVHGWGAKNSVAHYFRFKFPNWVKN